MNVSKQHRELCKRTAAKGVKILRIERNNKAFLVHFKDLLGRDRSCNISRALGGSDLFNAISDIIRLANDITPLNQPVLMPPTTTAQFAGGKSRYRQRQPPKPPRVVKAKDDSPQPRVLMGVEVKVESAPAEPIVELAPAEPIVELAESTRISYNVAAIRDRINARLTEFENRPEPVSTPEPKPGDTMQTNGFPRQSTNHTPVDKQPTATIVKKKIRRKHLLNKDRIRLTEWIIKNWDQIKAEEIPMTKAAKMATKDLGCTISSNNASDVAVSLGREWPGVKPKPQLPQDPSVKLLLESLCTIGSHMQTLYSDLGTPSRDLDRAVQNIRDLAKVLA